MVELLITMGMFVLAIAAISGVFVPLISQFKQQSRVAETQIEGIVGLDILRRDINSAGYGLPWEIPAGMTYQEALPATASPYNDSTTGIPRGIFSGNNITATGILTGTDYLVIKATNIALNDAAVKWTDVIVRSGGTKNVRSWGTSVEDLNTNDRVIVLNPYNRILSINGTSFTARFNLANFPDAYLTTPDVTYIIYGVDTPSGTDLRMPFNRADYFISTLGVPARCAPNTGVLTKAIVSQADGTLTSGAAPLLDCVADMQVDYWLDMDVDGDIDWSPPTDLNATTFPSSPANNISALNAKQIRNQLKEVRVYIVAHEGQKDPNFDFSQNNTREFLTALETLGASSRTLTFANLKTRIGDPAYKQYRWKLYTIVAKPRNLKIEVTQ
jgi:hypothetical protein